MEPHSRPPEDPPSSDSVAGILAEILELKIDPGPITLNSTLQDENTPLHIAVIWENEDYVRILLEAGADPNAQGDLGWTPLHSAVSKGYERIVKLLLLHGARTDIRDQLDSLPIDCCRKDSVRNILESWAAGERLP